MQWKSIVLCNRAKSKDKHIFAVGKSDTHLWKCRRSIFECIQLEFMLWKSTVCCFVCWFCCIFIKCQFVNEFNLFFPDSLDHPVTLKPLIAKVSSRTVSYVSNSQQHQESTIRPPQTLPKPSSFIQPPPTHPKPFTHSPQTQPKPQGFVQSLPKPFQPQPKAQGPPQTPPKPHYFAQTLVKSQSLPLDNTEDFSRNTSGNQLSPTESGDGLSDGMSAQQMSIKERWASHSAYTSISYVQVSFDNQEFNSKNKWAGWKILLQKSQNKMLSLLFETK